MNQPAPPLSPQQHPGAWDLVAATYAQDIAQWTTYADEALRVLEIGPSDRVLDVASGPGTLALRAAARAAHVHGVDFSSAMIDELRQRAAREGLTNIEGAVMDAQSLSFAEASFDAAFCLFGFFFFPDRARAFSELHRVLRPGGRALIATWSPIERRPLMRLGFEAFAEALPQFPRPGKGDLQDRDECVREMSDAGFRNVAAHHFSASMRFDSAEHYLATIARSTAPIAVMKKKLGDSAWDAAMASVLDVLRKRIPEGGIDLSAEAILTHGER